MSAEETPVEAWKRHVLECVRCGNSKSMGDLCVLGQHFWKPSPVPSPAVAEGVPPVPSPVVVASPSNSFQSPIAFAMGGIPVERSSPVPISLSVPITTHSPYSVPASVPAPVYCEEGLVPQAYGMVNEIANRVAEKVVARTRSGTSLAVPMEKRSTSVAIATAPGVMLYMPERDIEVYGEMKGMVSRLVMLAERMGKAIMVVEETRRHMKKVNPGKILDSDEVALVASQVGSRFGGLSEEDIYYEFEEVSLAILHLGDRLGNFMRVDDETRRVMQRTRTLAIEMKGELERAYGGRLAMDEETRRLVRESRMVALELQGEIERRVGT